MKEWAESFYKSKRWVDCRESFLSSKHYLCERCSTDENPVTATIAHHKIYLTPGNINDPTISLSWDNLEALCQDCHNKEHHGSHKPEQKRRYSFDESGQLVPIFFSIMNFLKSYIPPLSKTARAIFGDRWGTTNSLRVSA